MMKKIVYLVGLLIIMSNYSKAQEGDGRLGFCNFNVKNLSIKFCNYEGYKVKGTLKDFRTSDLQTPEGLMLSYESCNSQQWYDKLNEKSSDFSDSKIDLGNYDSNYVQLLNKILISKNGTDYCIMKFYIKRSSKGFPINFHLPACLSMQKINGSWKFISAPGFLEPYYDVMYSLQNKYLKQVFVEGKSDLPVLDLIIHNSINDGVINVGKFYYNYMHLFEGDYKNDPTIQMVNDRGYSAISNADTKVINENSVNTNSIASLTFYQREYKDPIVLYKGLSNTLDGANLILMELVTKSDPNNPVGALFKNVTLNDTSTNIAMIYKMELEYLDKIYEIVKYRIRKNNQESYGAVTMQKIDGNYKYTKLPSELQVWFDVINRLKPRYIDKIRSSSITKPTNFEEYYPIKEKSMDESGKLNISLLNNTLNEIQKSNPSLYNKVAN